MDYLTFALDEVDDGVTTLEAMASTEAAQPAAVMAEVQQVLDCAWRQFPDAHEPIDDGMHWDHDLQVTIEAGGWHTVTLTLTGTGQFVEEFIAVFGSHQAQRNCLDQGPPAATKPPHSTVGTTCTLRSVARSRP